VLNEIRAHVGRYGIGPGDVIVTNRLGKVTQHNAFGDCWHKAVTGARTCGKRPAPQHDGGRCGGLTCG
jgi:hypothetical protein